MNPVQDKIIPFLEDFDMIDDNHQTSTEPAFRDVPDQRTAVESPLVATEASSVPGEACKQPGAVKAEKRRRATESEKIRWLVEQKKNQHSNREIAVKAGVSEGAIRRWRKDFPDEILTQHLTAPGKKRPVPRPVIPPPQQGQCSPSISELLSTVEALRSRCQALESELAVLKGVARHYIA